MRLSTPYDQQIPPLGWQTTVVIILAVLAVFAYGTARAIRRGR
jgi:hypothetical protein